MPSYAEPEAAMAAEAAPAPIMAAARPRIPAGSSLCGRSGNILCRILKNLDVRAV